MTAPRLALVVDADQSLRRLFEVFLGHNGYLSHTCGDADAALVAVKATPALEVAVIEAGAAGRSGAALAREVWALRPELPVLFISGDGPVALDGSVDADRLYTNLRKPFTLGAMTAALEMLNSAVCV